ncbi:MAG: ribosomal protein S18-alanine N-acetyltransferase [Eubacterium sp.]|nr:ribosomal protein S18-alanine N-acetyltransferase [Eubacterium sp.]
MIRTMEPGDIPAVSSIERECFSRPWQPSDFEDAVVNPDTLFVVSELDGEVAGYVGAYISLDECEITNVAVGKAYRRRGVGRELIDGFSRRLVQRGVCRIHLEVRCSNEGAIALYEGAGFERVGVRPGFYRDPKEDAILMTRDLQK